jgi:hypothetical protein
LEALVAVTLVDVDGALKVSSEAALSEVAFAYQPPMPTRTP